MSKPEETPAARRHRIATALDTVCECGTPKEPGGRCGLCGRVEATEPTTAPLTAAEADRIYTTEFRRVCDENEAYYISDAQTAGLLAVATEAAARARAEMLARLDAVPVQELATAYLKECEAKGNPGGLVWERGMVAVRAALLAAVATKETP